MNKVSGDSKVVCGAPVPSENGIDIPPRTAGEKDIEEGTIFIEAYDNTKELVEEVNRKYNNKEEKEH